MQDGNHIIQITEFARALCSAQDYHSLLDVISKQICGRLSTENVLLWIFDEDDHALRCEASSLTTLNRALVREARTSNAGLLGEVLRADAPRIFRELEATSHLPEPADGIILKAAVFATMRDRSNPVGVIEAIN